MTSSTCISILDERKTTSRLRMSSNVEIIDLISNLFIREKRENARNRTMNGKSFSKMAKIDRIVEMKTLKRKTESISAMKSSFSSTDETKCTAIIVADNELSLFFSSSNITDIGPLIFVKRKINFCFIVPM